MPWDCGFPVPAARHAAERKAVLSIFRKMTCRGWQMSLKWIILALYKHGAGGSRLFRVESVCL